MNRNTTSAGRSGRRLMTSRPTDTELALPGAKIPDLVRQEFYGLLMAHFAVRALMHKAALRGYI